MFIEHYEEVVQDTRWECCCDDDEGNGGGGGRPDIEGVVDGNGDSSFGKNDGT